MVTQNMLRTCEENRTFSTEKNRFATALDLNKCIKQIKLPILRRTCAPFFEVPSNISTMYLLYLYVTCIALSFVMI